MLDPVDGSTNASRRIPWFATSICVLDDDGPLAALVVNQANGTTYEAARGGGARRDGQAIAPSSRETLGRSLIGLSGLPARVPRLAPVPVARRRRARPVRGRGRDPRRLHRLHARRARELGLPRRSARVSPRRAPSWPMPRGVSSSCVTTTDRRTPVAACTSALLAERSPPEAPGACSLGPRWRAARRTTLGLHRRQRRSRHGSRCSWSSRTVTLPSTASPTAVASCRSGRR